MPFPDRAIASFLGLAFGNAVGEAFSPWLDDPLTPSTAPGNTRIAGARAWQQTRNWRTCGVPNSDGCGAVMRVVPIGIAFAGEELDRAARISATVTHGHPNAAEAAIATCRLLRLTLELGRLDVATVESVLRDLPRESVTAAALRAALDTADGPWDGWLAEQSIPPGDGGWRSPNALGLAVAAAGGTKVLPPAWRDETTITWDGRDQSSREAPAGSFWCAWRAGQGRQWGGW